MSTFPYPLTIDDCSTSYDSKTFSWPNSFEIIGEDLEASFQQTVPSINSLQNDVEAEIEPPIQQTKITESVETSDTKSIVVDNLAVNAIANRNFVNQTSNPLITGLNILVSKIFIVTNNVQLTPGPNPIQINGLEFIIFNNNPRDTITVTSTTNNKILAKIKPNRAAQFVYIAVINKFARI
jgi:hypothetical protein